MSVRTFTMPSSLNESLASSQPPNSGTGRSSPNCSSKIDHSLAEKQSPAPHTPKKRSGITFASQEKLPKLPIPELESTCRKYIEALKPLQSRREQAETATAVQEFLKSEGPELQERLKKYATGKTSYIEQFCKYFLLQ